MKTNPAQKPLPKWWDPDRIALLLPKLKARNQILSVIKDWFRKEGFIEVETPVLQESPGLEPHLLAFQTTLLEPFSASGSTMYLQSSPEYAMKKLLVAGMTKIFQVARCYRNAERSTVHHPEFTMLEWYRSDATWRQTANDTEALIKAAASATGRKEVKFKENLCDLGKPFNYLSVTEAFLKFAKIDLRLSLIDPHFPDGSKLAKMAKDSGIRIGNEDSWDVIFDRILIEKVEPKLGLGRGTVLHDYPLPLAALARGSPDDPCLAERFEVYMCGIELANGFGELSDPVEQRQRFEKDLTKKKALGMAVYPIDEDFLDALDVGMPSSSGVALGLDRLVMLMAGAKCIEDVIWAPVVTDS